MSKMPQDVDNAAKNYAPDIEILRKGENNS